jgi:hypothetical protein
MIIFFTGGFDKAFVFTGYTILVPATHTENRERERERENPECERVSE